MARKLPSTDVVIIGLGWTGSMMAHELSAAGLNVVAIERGPWRDTATDFPTTYVQDELRYVSRDAMFVPPAVETLTFRNNQSQTALPMRSWTSFKPGTGVGGAGVHWNGQTWRFLPTDFEARSHLSSRYGESFLPEGTLLQDFGVTYDELEPHYDRFEKLCGTSGTAGNIKGKIQPGGNPFEGPRSSEYPTPAIKQPYGPTLFADAARKLGYSPFPQPCSNLSQAYTNPLGIAMGPCTYCGFCERFGCGNYSKASPQTTILPALVRFPNFTARPNCEVLKINLDSTGKKAVGVTYVDAQGEEWDQPADLVLVCAFSFFSVRLLMLSGIGTPYNPMTGEGVVGRNFAYQTQSNVDLFFEDKILNPFIATGANGMIIDDFNGDNFDHGPLGFVGGAYLGALQTNGRPIATRPVPPGTPSWGAAWKEATSKYYLRSYSLGAFGSSYSYRDCYLDLDPTYKDRHGRPLLRMQFDFHENELKLSAFATAKLAEIGHAMGAQTVVPHPRTGPYSVVPYQTTHVTGGTIMGTDPKNSVVNRYLQSWDVPNVFVFGASVFPQNSSYNPTGTIGALTYWAADAIKNQYLKNPGPLVQA
jgi:gluconate 2-dehydrogenase alpha chain